MSWPQMSERALVEQRKLVATCHPMVSKRRASLTGIVDLIEAALAKA